MSSSLSRTCSFRYRIANRGGRSEYPGISICPKPNTNNHLALCQQVCFSRNYSTGSRHVTSSLLYKRYSFPVSIRFDTLVQQCQMSTTKTLPSPWLPSSAQLLQNHFQIAPQRQNTIISPSRFNSVSNYQCCVRMSSTLTENTSNQSMADNTSKKSSTDSNNESEKKKSNETSGSSNIFLDNLGTMFLIFIGSIIGWLVRSYYNGARKNAVRETLIESTAHADPIELDDLRIANTELTPSVFYEIIQHIIDQTATITTTDAEQHDRSSSSVTRMTYPKFVQLVRTAMIKMKGEAFTIQCGHVIDRIVLAALIKYDNRSNDPPNTVNSNTGDILDDTTTGTDDNRKQTLIDKIEMPIEFWLTVLSLALYSSAKERIEILHSVFHHFSLSPTAESNGPKITMSQVIQLIGYLQDTCQLVPDAQIIMTSHKYPLQEYIVGSPEQMIDHQQWDVNADENKVATSDMKSLKGHNITVDMLSDILSSRSVCAWGECYKYKSK